MAGDGNGENDVKLPPKLDLRRQGILRENPVAAAVPNSAGDGRPKTETVRLVVPPEPAATAQAEAAVNPAPPAAAQPSAAADTLGARAAPMKPLQPKGMPPSAATVAGPEGTAETKPGAKHETSRIPLEFAKGRPMVPADRPKTILIKPGVPVPPRKATQPLTVTQVPTPLSDADTAAAAKRKTSRIPLEAAFTAERKDAGSGAGGPKTIKLKRPGEAATVKAAEMAQTEEGAAAPEAKAGSEGRPASGDTARLDEQVPAASEEETPTRKKTIRVKRPSDTPGVRAAGPLPISVTSAETAVAEDEPGWVWALVNVAAIAVVAVVVWMLAAQVFGPNASLTPLSYNVNGPDLAWPGKISAAR